MVPPNQAQGKKRKRQQTKQKRLAPEEEYQLERTEQYNKLVHFSSKALHKQAKVVKSFLSAKVVKKLKEAKNSAAAAETTRTDVSSSSSNSKHAIAVKKLEEQLMQLKALDLQQVVDVGLFRLGIRNLAPKEQPTGDINGKQTGEEKGALAQGDESPGDTKEQDMEKKKKNEKGPAQLEQSSSNAQNDMDKNTTQWIEKMLQHSRLSNAIESLHSKVTEHRRWIMRREEYIRGGDEHQPVSNASATSSRRKKQPRKNQKKTSGGVDMAGHDANSALFLESLGGGSMNEQREQQEDHRYGYYGYGDGDDAYASVVQKKKNRPGQQQRRAKAMAIQARKEGRTWDKSINWREKKQDDQDEHGSRKRAHGSSNKASKSTQYERGAPEKKNVADKPMKKAQPEKIATMGKVWKEEGQAHPSWAARQAQKSGIVEFTGKKITF